MYVLREHRDVVEPVGSVVAAILFNRVDAVEDPVRKPVPINSVETRIQIQVRRIRGTVRHLGRIYQHFGGDTAHIQARPSKQPLFSDRDFQVAEPVVNDRVSRASSNDKKIKMCHRKSIYTGQH